MKWLNSESMMARRKLPGLASQVPVETSPDGDSKASRVASRGTGLAPTAAGEAPAANSWLGIFAGVTM